MPDLNLTRLDDLSVLDARGADVIPFLQGQVTQDVTRLPERGALLAGLNNPQGRVLAVLRLLFVAGDHVLIVLPAELSEAIRQLLGRYVLRAKVKITDATAVWRVYGIAGPDAAAAAATRLHMVVDAEGWRQLIVAPRGEPLPEADAASRDVWRRSDMEAGLPEVVEATSGSFVAQMLNLDLVDAISLTKGCYTGQEVVARAHYRGQVKRRMQRFFTDSPQVLEPGARIRLGDGRHAQIVVAAPAESGGQEFLAVTAINPASEVESASVDDAHLRIAVQQLSLPYTPA